MSSLISRSSSSSCSVVTLSADNPWKRRFRLFTPSATKFTKPNSSLISCSFSSAKCRYNLQINTKPAVHLMPVFDFSVVVFDLSVDTLIFLLQPEVSQLVDWILISLQVLSFGHQKSISLLVWFYQLDLWFSQLVEFFLLQVESFSLPGALLTFPQLISPQVEDFQSAFVFWVSLEVLCLQPSLVVAQS